MVCKRKKTNWFKRNTKYTKLNDTKLNETKSQHTLMPAKPVNSWDCKKLEESHEDDNLALDDEDDHEKNSD